MPGHDFNKGAKRAREARRDLGLHPADPVPCLLDVVETKAALPVALVGLPEHTAGACTQFGDKRLLWVNGRQPRVRQRFTLAHELGHAWCGHDGTLVVDSFETLHGGTTDTNELQANAFAGEFLIPKVALVALVEGSPTLDEIVVVSAHFGTSAAMTLVRLRQLGLVSAEGCAEVFGQIDRSEHFEAWKRLGCTEIADRLAGIERLPYVSESLQDSRLGAVLSGDAAADPALAAALARFVT